jgi:integral membrane protein
MNRGTVLRWLAVIEAVTLLILVLVAVPLKHFAGIAEATRIVGPVHGLAFIAFCWAVIRSSSEGWLSKRDVTRLLIGAFIPFGGIVNERWLQGRLTEAKVDAL